VSLVERIYDRRYDFGSFKKSPLEIAIKQFRFPRRFRFARATLTKAASSFVRSARFSRAHDSYSVTRYVVGALRSAGDGRRGQERESERGDWRAEK